MPDFGGEEVATIFIGEGQAEILIHPCLFLQVGIDFAHLATTTI